VEVPGGESKEEEAEDPVLDQTEHEEDLGEGL
jgi:hypothetical protein